MRRVPLLLLSLALLALARAGVAAPGDPDETFSSDGIATADFGADERAYAVVVQPDGRIVAAGARVEDGAGDLALVRFDAGGALDPSFGAGGLVVTDLGADDEVVRGLALLPDGRLVAAGVSGGDIVLVRYQADGTPDPSFGTGGVVTTDVAGGSDSAHALQRTAGGKLLVAGSAFTGLFTDLALLRYEAGGARDTGFGSGGVATVAVGFDAAVARALAIQGDGRLLVAGSADFFTQGDEVALARFTAAGALDATFDGDGILTPSLTNGDDAAHAVALQADGRIVVAGHMASGGAGHIAVLRRLVGGGLDPSFDLDGLGLYPLGSASAARGLLAQGDGRLLLAGWRVSGGQSDVALMRLDADGAPDPGFGAGGVVVAPVGAGDDAGEALAADGARLVVAGRSSNGSDDDFAVLRFVGSDCGDASLDLGEQCDDGNLAAGDCCSPTCQYEASGCAADALPCTADRCNGAGACVHPVGHAGVVCRPPASPCDAAELCTGASTTCPADAAAADGTSCADGLFCNGAETCQSGICGSGAPACAGDCDEELDFCPGRCPPFARSDCRMAERNVLTIRRGDGSPRLVWRWLGGGSTAHAELADPRADAGYRLCLYEGVEGRLAAETIVPPQPARWRALGAQADRGFRYADPAASAAGVKRILLRPGAGGAARAFVVGVGPGLVDPALPLELPVRVQLENGATGVCLESAFAAARRNDAFLFRD